MAHVIESVFISSRCPKALESITKQVKDLRGYLLEDNILEPFIDTLKRKVEVSKIKDLELKLCTSDHGGCIIITKKYDCNSLVRIPYLTIQGYIVVSPNKENIYQQQVFQEEKGE